MARAARTFILVSLVITTLACKARSTESTKVAATNDDATAATGSGAQVSQFNSDIPAAVNSSEVPGDITVVTYSGPSRTAKRIDTCFLVHGYGFTPPAYQFIKNYAAPLFADIYFGPKTVSRLLDTVCNQVIVLIQESNDTTILEMTERTEAAMRAMGCEEPVSGEATQWSCALIGHSKGGAVATNIARRCMNMSPASRLGEKGCKGLGEIYSATGVPLGAGATLLVYGAYNSSPSQARDALLGGFATLAGSMIRAGLEAATSRALISSINFVWKLDAPYEQNPTWRDLSPGALMEDGVPLYLINSELRLDKTGWLVADYAASGNGDQIGVNAGIGGIGCGTPTGGLTSPNRIGCEAFGHALIALHLDMLKSTFLDGQRLATWNNKFFDPRPADVGPAHYFSQFTWESYQLGDGLADLQSALGPCRNGGSAVPPQSCTLLKGINHQASAGGAQEALDDFVLKLSQ